jgi:hypothetical protein
VAGLRAPDGAERAGGRRVIVGALLLLIALLGAPLFAVIGASALFGFQSEEIDLSVVAIEFFRLAEMPVLLAIPLFTFAGYLLGESQAPQRIVRTTDALLGWLPGGLAMVAVAACALFTAFTGASGVTIVALGALLYPALRQKGYADHFSLGLVTTSGSLGLRSTRPCASTTCFSPGCFRVCSCSACSLPGVPGRAARCPRRVNASRGARRSRRCASRPGRSRCPSSC